MLSTKFSPEDNILCSHKNCESYTGIEGEDFYGDLCDDCLTELKDKLNFDATEQKISHISPKGKHRKYVNFQQLINELKCRTDKHTVDFLDTMDAYLIILDDGCCLIDATKDNKTRSDVGNKHCVSDENRYWSTWIPKRNGKTYIKDAARQFGEKFNVSASSVEGDRFSFTASINGKIELINGKIEKLNFEEETNVR